MKRHIGPYDKVSGSVRLEIQAEKLLVLFQDGHLHAADVRCLDRASKRSVWRLCLDCCLKSCTARRTPSSRKKSVFPIKANEEEQ